MDKQELVRRLKELNLPRYQYVIIAGSALTLRDLRDEVKTIDLAISDVLATELKIHNLTPDADGHYHIATDIIVTIGMNRVESEEVDGFLCETVHSIYGHKKGLDRPKDQGDLDLLHEYFTEQSRS